MLLPHQIEELLELLLYCSVTHPTGSSLDFGAGWLISSNHIDQMSVEQKHWAILARRTYTTISVSIDTIA